MASRTKRRQPYNPVLAEYQKRQQEAEDAKKRDRKSQDLLRNARVAAMEVVDPSDGEKIVVLRSTRDDPLADLHARHMIDEAQYHAGRAFQNDYQTAERGPRAIDPSKEAVDGGLMPEPITEAQRRSAKQLAVVYRALGQDGSAIVHAVLVHNQTRKQVASSRGLIGERWEKYYGLRFQECLDCMALVYGFSMEKR